MGDNTSFEFDKEMLQAFVEVQQPRPDYVLEKFVIGEKDTEPQAYAQCVVELQIKYMSIRRGELSRKKILAEKAELAEKQSAAGLSEHQRAIIEADIGMKQIDLEEQELAIIGAKREFAALYAIWKSFSKKYTREELNADQPEYWRKRLTRQSNLDMLASGRVSVGNADALRMVGMSTVPELNHIRDTERRYLETGNVRILIAVPTEMKAENGLPCLEGLQIPTGMQVRYYNVWGRKIDAAYNDAALTCLRDGADFMLTIEDDTFPPPDALVRLYEHAKKGMDIVGAWYPMRAQPIRGAVIELADGARRSMDPDGTIKKAYTLPMGCTLIAGRVFSKLTFPYFATTDCLTQDSFFSQLAREAGFELFCDTAIRCRHIDRTTGEVFE